MSEDRASEARDFERAAKVVRSVQPAPPRALSADEEALLEALRDVAGEALDEGHARLDVEWWRLDGGPIWADFVLSPSDPAACRVSVSPSGSDWIDFNFGPAGSETTFELSAASADERLVLLRQCVEAVLDGRFEIELRRLARPLVFGRTIWEVVGTFHLPTGRLAYSRIPAELERYRFAFGDPTAGDGKERVIGPHRFSPYMPS
jgi:hypothetical protein